MKPISSRIPGALLLALCAGSAHANEALPSTAGSIAQMLFGLVIVLAALIGTLFLLRRLQAGRSQIIDGLKVIGATHVGPRERVVLLNVGSKVLVLGVTPGRVNALHVLDAAELPMKEAAAQPVTADFAARLRQLLEKRHAS